MVVILISIFIHCLHISTQNSTHALSSPNAFFHPMEECNGATAGDGSSFAKSEFNCQNQSYFLGRHRHSLRGGGRSNVFSICGSSIVGHRSSAFFCGVASVLFGFLGNFLVLGGGGGNCWWSVVLLLGGRNDLFVLLHDSSWIRRSIISALGVAVLGNWVLGGGNWWRVVLLGSRNDLALLHDSWIRRNWILLLLLVRSSRGRLLFFLLFLLVLRILVLVGRVTLGGSFVVSCSRLVGIALLGWRRISGLCVGDGLFSGGVIVLARRRFFGQ
mmetsp:Transcript_27570/g.67047  ORF Transcript_27570/g.67047 Transcript_27570/m.67047 type:complete len:272 (+) Transcript_27570:51-866(+)